MEEQLGDDGTIIINYGLSCGCKPGGTIPSKFLNGQGVEAPRSGPYFWSMELQRDSAREGQVEEGVRVALLRLVTDRSRAMGEMSDSWGTQEQGHTSLVKSQGEGDA